MTLYQSDPRRRRVPGVARESRFPPLGRKARSLQRITGPGPRSYHFTLGRASQFEQLLLSVTPTSSQNGSAGGPSSSVWPRLPSGHHLRVIIMQDRLEVLWIVLNRSPFTYGRIPRSNLFTRPQAGDTGRRCLS